MSDQTLRALLLIKTKAKRNDAEITKDWLREKSYTETSAVLWGDFDVYAIISASNNAELTRIIIKEIQVYEHVVETRTMIIASHP